MLAVEQRLRRRDEFTAAVRAGRRAARGCLVVHVLAGARPGGAHDRRAGFIVPRTVGSAVARNTVRRRLRHLMRERLARLAPGTDIVVRVLPGAVDRSYGQLGADLDAAIMAAMVGRAPARGVAR